MRLSAITDFFVTMSNVTGDIADTLVVASSEDLVDRSRFIDK